MGKIILAIACIAFIGLFKTNAANQSKDSLAFDMVLVKGGNVIYSVGKDQDEDHDEEYLDRNEVAVNDFYIGCYEVTQAQWKAVMGNNPSLQKGDSLPVENIGWDKAQEFIKRLNIRTGKNYRLPTSAEWEYAAIGGEKSIGYKYSGGNNADEVAWHEDNSGRTTHPVGTKKPNELGLYDMSGNVWELCDDFWGAMAPLFSHAGSFRVYRGSSCYSSIMQVSASMKYLPMPNYPGVYVGFRLACSVSDSVNLHEDNDIINLVNKKYDALDYHQIGFEYQSNGEYALAIAAFKRAIQVESNLPDAYYNMGICYLPEFCLNTHLQERKAQAQAIF
jgi:formylglycine-generating enzyme required for sulfatase activity